MTPIDASTMPPAATPATDSWLHREFATVDFGDKRLDKRFLKSGAQLAAQPSAPINQACDDWADTKATYGLFRNPKVTPDAIRAPHLRRTAERMAAYEVVLAIQDTTLLDYSSHTATEGLGPIGRDDQPALRGLLLHTTLARTPDGLPLGLLDQQVWRRPERADRPSAAQKQRLPIEEKESFKWIRALRRSAELTPDAVRLVTVCDREGDIYELLAEARAVDTDLLVRAYQSRATTDQRYADVWAAVDAQPVATYVQIDLPPRAGEPARRATVAVRYRTVTLQPPAYRAAEAALPPLTLSALRVEEVNPPPEVTALDWKLLSTVLVHNSADALERLNWYAQRWGIELFHKVLKSGCTVEDCRLATAERLTRYVALMSIIAWRLYWLSYMGRTHPTAPASTVLADHEWQALYVTIHRTPELPEEVPTVRQTVRWLAQLGGFLGRTYDGQPGVTAIWRGWQRLQDRAELYRLLSPPSATYG